MVKKKVIKIVVEYGNRKKTVKTANPEYAITRIKNITKGW